MHSFHLMRPSAARHCGAQSTAAPPSAPLLPRARAGAQYDVVPPWYGTDVAQTARLAAPAECWLHLQTMDESYLAPIPAVAPCAAPETAIQHVVPAPAVTYTSPAPVIEHVAPTPPEDTFAAPAPVIQYVARAPADTDTTPESMTEYVAPVH